MISVRWESLWHSLPLVAPVLATATVTVLILGGSPDFRDAASTRLARSHFFMPYYVTIL